MSAARHPRRGHLQFRRHEHPVVAAPTAAALRHPVFQDGHARTVQPSNDRLHHARTEVQALQSWGRIEGLHQVGTRQRLGFPFRKTGGRHLRLPQHHLQLAHPNVDVLEGSGHRLGFETDTGKSQGINAVWTRHAERPCRICGHGQATRPSHHHRSGQLGRGRWLKDMAFHCGRRGDLPHTRCPPCGAQKHSTQWHQEGLPWT